MTDPSKFDGLIAYQVSSIIGAAMRECRIRQTRHYEGSAYKPYLLRDEEIPPLRVTRRSLRR
jgi:hypothetical protein